MFSASGDIQPIAQLESKSYAAYLRKEGIDALMRFPEMTGKSDLNLGFAEKYKIVLFRGIFSLKSKFQEAVNRTIAEPEASFIGGILLGSRQNIPQEIKDAFSRTSTTHILAISGYNISIVAELILAVSVLFVRRRTAFWISFAAIFAFTILTGASASVVRASIMGLLYLFASGYGLLYNARNSIALAGAVMVFTNPFVLNFDVGFQLSFLAVIGLIYIYPVIDSRFKKIPGMGGLKEVALMTVSAQLAVLPLLIYSFQNFSVVSLPANIMILPFVPFSMLFGFISGISGMIFNPLGQFLGYFAWAVSAYQIGVVNFFANLPFSSFFVSIRWTTMLVVYLILFFVVWKKTDRE